MRVLKFGGTSMSGADSIRLVFDIVKCDPENNRFVVVSAPGRTPSGDGKVTDMLLDCFKHRMKYGAVGTSLQTVEDRFGRIVSDLGIDFDLRPYFDEIRQNLNGGANADYASSRGEYLIGRILAHYLGYDFIDADRIIKFDTAGIWNPEMTDAIAKKELAEYEHAVIPGFYGAMPSGAIKTFSRGGSDITGAIIARAAGAQVYENWTDVDGFFACDPKMVGSSRLLDVVSYDELRELSYMGANVLHPEAIFPVRKDNIPIHIRNTFSPGGEGTLIVPTKQLLKGFYGRQFHTMTGIAGKCGFAAVFIEKSMMNNELGFARKALSVFEKFGISVEHIPTSIDTLTVVVDRTNIPEEVLSHAILEIKDVCRPDDIQYVSELALITVVGHGMKSKKGTAARVFGALAKKDISIPIIIQSISEFSIIFAVEENDLCKAISAVYNEFSDEKDFVEI